MAEAVKKERHAAVEDEQGRSEPDERAITGKHAKAADAGGDCAAEESVLEGKSSSVAAGADLGKHAGAAGKSAASTAPGKPVADEASSAAVDVARTKKPVSAAKKRERTQLAHRWLRYYIQLVFFIGAPALFSGAFNGVKYLFTQIGLGDAIEPTSFLVQLVAVLAFTILFGRFFCGYACAFGAIGDWLYNAFELLRKKTNIPRPEFSDRQVKALSLLKYVVLAAICAACFAGVWASFSSYSPWVAFAAILAGSVDGVGAIALGILAVIVVLMIVRERFFCEFLCPLGAVFSLMPVLGCSEFVRTRAHCAKNCGRCQEACPVDIWPDADAIRHGECISCGRCADACPMSNVNMVAIERKLAKQERLAAEQKKAEKASLARAGKGGQANAMAHKAESAQLDKAAEAKLVARPLRKTKEKWHLLKGNEIGYVIVKAVLLLAICWIVGAARYVPSFIEVFGFSPLPF